MKEHGIQNEIRNALAGQCLLFRANVGQAWAGDVTKLPGNRVVIDNARPFNTGLPPGFADLFGLVSVEITPDMVGKKVAIFTALEVKTSTGRASSKQTDFLQAVANNGGRSGVVRSAADALNVIRGE
jgi:hypothetical protein